MLHLFLFERQEKQKRGFVFTGCDAYSARFHVMFGFIQSGTNSIFYCFWSLIICRIRIFVFCGFININAKSTLRSA